MFDQDRLISYKQNFTGQKFQWVKTDRPELIGKVVRCKDVEPVGNMIMAIFDDGSKMDASKINTHMLMIHGDMQPLTKDEVESIYGGVSKPQTQEQPKVQPHSESVKTSPVNNTEQVKQAPRQNMFEMFNSEDTTLTLSLNIKLPNKKLLKMMYDSSDNKEKFLEELSEYIHSLINKKVINTSVFGMLVPQVKKKSESTENVPIKFTQVDGDK